MPEDLLAKEVRQLVQRLRLFTPSRWAVTCELWGTRADVARHLAQWFADEAARLEGTPQRVLPRLPSDLLVADQVAVTGDDLVRAAPPTSLTGEAVDHLLLHRYDLLGEEPPASLGGSAALVRGRTVCHLPTP